MAVSILNRAMGVGLATVGVVALVWWLAAAATGAEAYAVFMGWATSWIGYVFATGLCWAFSFHLCAGLRHFVMDAGAGFELGTNHRLAWITILASFVLTGAIGLAVLYKGI